MRQWMLAITKYADRLLSDLGGLDWDDSIKGMQRNWIGRSEARRPLGPEPWVSAGRVTLQGPEIGRGARLRTWVLVRSVTKDVKINLPIDGPAEGLLKLNKASRLNKGF